MINFHLNKKYKYTAIIVSIAIILLITIALHYFFFQKTNNSQTNFNNEIKTLKDQISLNEIQYRNDKDKYEKKISMLMEEISTLKYEKRKKDMIINNLKNKQEQISKKNNWIESIIKIDDTKFTINYPDDWYFDDNSFDKNFFGLRTKKFYERKKDGFEIQKPGDENEIIKEYEGLVKIIKTDKEIMEKICPSNHRFTEKINIGNYKFQGCINMPEAVTIPKLFLKIPNTEDIYLQFIYRNSNEIMDGGKITDYNLLIIDILETLRFIKRDCR